MVGRAMPTTFVGHYLLWMWLFVSEDSRLLTMAKRLVIAAYHVTDGIVSCCVGFLKRELTKFSSLYEGMLAVCDQATLLLSSSHAYLKKQSGSDNQQGR